MTNATHARTMKALLITLDDVNRDLIASAATPELDRIRAGGKEFTRFVAAPNCSNFRAKLQSGMHSPRPDNLVGGVIKASTTYSLPATPTVLGKCGASAHIGKWHCSEHTSYGHRIQHGYDLSAGSVANLYPGDYFDWTTVEQGVPRPTQEYATDYVTERALSAIFGNYDLIVAAYNAVHEPVHAPPGMNEASREAMLAYADAGIGELHDTAIANGYLVMLVSDNGCTADEGGKGNLSNLALDAPLVLSGNWPPTRWHDQPTDTTDIHATIWTLVHGALPPGTDGVPLMEPRDFAFADHFLAVGKPPGQRWQECATDGSLKLIRRPSTGAYVLTDWWDQPAPTGSDPQPLLDALDGRLR